MPTLTQLTQATGLDVEAHVADMAAGIEIPITDQLQFQGDLAVIPLAMAEQGAATRAVKFHTIRATWQPVPAAGIEVLRGESGGHPHTLVADPGACRWTTTGITDPTGLTLGVLEATEPVYLLHPEHGGTGIAPGTYVIRGQREHAQQERRVAD
jgi:hypothetical protein